MERGVRQVAQITLRLCEHSGSSSGARIFVAQRLESMKNALLGVELQVEQLPGRHPHVEAVYRNGARKVLSVKNKSVEGVEEGVLYMSNQSGRKVKKDFRASRPIASSPSIQGMWTPRRVPNFK
mmetsp:Transcript_48333/g.125355  ORF Transcript_48333/g.125355 Transcript_48333/m.125355 type:complete len:124 (-) Transcript_48333:1165-1536(-)